MWLCGDLGRHDGPRSGLALLCRLGHAGRLTAALTLTGMDVSSSESFVFTLPTSARVVNGVKIADLSGGGGGTGAGTVAIAFEVSDFTAAVDTLARGLSSSHGRSRH